MTVFKYKALTRESKEVTGLVEAAHENAATDILRDKNLKVVYLKQRTVIDNIQQLFVFGGVKIKDLVIFSRQFAVLMSANVALVESLKILIAQTANAKLKLVVAEITEEVDGGARLSDSLAKRPKVFSDFFVNVVKSGETSGKLADVLTYLADEMEKDYDIMSKIRGAMIYPAFILTGLAVVGTIMMVSVLPKLLDVIRETGAELPLPTKILIGVSNFMQSYWWLIGLSIIGSIVGVKFIVRNPAVKKVVDIMKLKMPIFGTLFRNIYLVRFTRTLSTLLIGGVTIGKGLRITSNVVTNAVFRELIDETVKEVEDGNSISTVFLESKVIPDMVSQMMTIGEKTGQLSMILDRITDFYSREIDDTLTNMMTLMEPMIMIVMGIAVGIMVAAIILPMYNMASSM